MGRWKIKNGRWKIKTRLSSPQGSAVVENKIKFFHVRKIAVFHKDSKKPVLLLHFTDDQKSTKIFMKKFHKIFAPFDRLCAYS